MEYDKSKIELVVLSLVDSDIIKLWTPEGFAKFTHLTEVANALNARIRTHIIVNF